MKKTGLDLPFIECAFLTETPLASTEAPPRVDQLMTCDFVRLPAWFPAGKAARVLQQKAAAYALVTGPRGAGLASAADITSAPDTKCVSWCATPLGRVVKPDLDIDDVRDLMDAQSTDGLPVVIDGLIVGIITRDAIVAAEVAARPPSERLAA